MHISLHCDGSIYPIIGDIIESGDHEQLIKQNGFYAELYNSQFEKVS